MICICEDKDQHKDQDARLAISRKKEKVSRKIKMQDEITLVQQGSQSIRPVGQLVYSIPLVLIVYSIPLVQWGRIL